MNNNFKIQIYSELQFAFQGKAGAFYPKPLETDKIFNSILDLEKAYGYIANSRIHLFSDGNNWAIVFESNDYDTRGLDAQITLHYIGNCINYSIQLLPKYRIISNTIRIPLIDFEEFYRIEIKDEEGNDIEQGQLVAENISEIKIRNLLFPWNYSAQDLLNVGINVRKDYNSDNLIDFPSLVRFLNHIRPDIMTASESEIRTCIIPDNLPFLMTILDFNYMSLYKKPCNIAEHETFQLIAQVLCSQNIDDWKPTLKANNHWKNWISGNL